MSELYSWWSNVWYIWPGKMKKMLKQMKSSYKKADEIKKESEMLSYFELEEAEKFLDCELKNLNDKN